MENLTFGIANGGKGLRLYTDSMWDEHLEQLDNLKYFNQNHLQLMRTWSRVLAEVNIDSAGRILLPKRVKELFGLDSELAFNCMLDVVELKSKEVYEREFFGTDYQAMSQTSNAVMGGKDDVTGTIDNL